ncbi:hypothetical protein [Limnohabitans sp. JirII-31]|uniref:hypothetical protein n=1 Tax=Limnohabitans sp. JirII-31 TaxID=1977908 RepID=UPI000C1E3B55|nr:hypothetical protein [Limnohabitans sp. JirII-31]PIT80868.1 hypothetical protein B9Z41_02910 [Limnohabitans sp. JirII-31]
MKLSTYFSPLAVASCLIALIGCLSTPSWANDPKKAEPVKEEKKFKYVDEEGETGRGYTYKRVIKEAFEEPKPVAKEEPKPAPKAESKDAHGKDPHAKPEEKKKDDGHGGDDHKEPKKEEKKKDDGHGGGHGNAHGKEAKKEEPTVSALYDKAIIKLDGNNRPFTTVSRTTKTADYFLCRDVVSTKYRKTVLGEMNTFADRMGLPHAQELPCMVKVAKPNTKFPGAVYLEFYVDDKAAVQCMQKGECGATRLVMLFPKDKTGKHSKEIYRSYVLTDQHKYQRGSFCVSPEGQLLGEKNCYVALNPDWLFN